MPALAHLLPAVLRPAGATRPGWGVRSLRDLAVAVRGLVPDDAAGMADLAAAAAPAGVPGPPVLGCRPTPPPTRRRPTGTPGGRPGGVSPGHCRDAPG